MASKKLVIRGGLDLNAPLGSGGSDPVLTRNPTTKEVGETTPLLIGLPTTLLQGYIYIGDNTNTAQARLPIGDINLTDLGLVTINDGVITNNKVSPTAGIAYSKLNLVNSIVNADIATAAAIVRSKLAIGAANRVVITNSSGVMIDANAITPSRVLISDVNGIPTDSGLTTTVLGYVDPTSSIQTQLNNRLFFSSSITPNEGDIVAFQSGVWNSFPRGSSGQYLTSTVGGLAWTTTPNGLPVGGVGNEILRKIDATDYNTEWHTLVIADLTDITANAAQVNELATGYYDATSSIQTQFSLKLNNALANNSMFIGNSSNQVSQLAPGSNGQVLTIVAGVPQWQTVSGTGTVTSVAFSGGSTGLTVTGSPITTSGTITLAGTLGIANGGTNITSYTTGDLPYASSSTVLSKLGIGTNGYVLTVSGGLPSWQPNIATTPLTTKGDIFIYSTTNDRLPVGTDGYHLTADSTDPTGLKWTAPVVNPFSDLNPILYNNADPTKLARLDVSNITTGTTRVYTLPDFNGTIALLGSTNGAALSKVDDTNITLTLSAGSATALLNATTITAVWSGTLADARITSSANWNTAYDRSGTSLGFTSSTFTFTKQDASTLTVAVPTFNQNTTGSSGSVANALTVDNSSLQLNSGTTYDGSAAKTISVKALGITNSLIANTTIDLTTKVTGLLPYANFSNGTGLSVVGRSANTSGVQADIVGTNNQVLRVSGTTLGFGSIDLSQSATIGSSVLPVANGGTNISSYAVGDLIYASGSTTLSKLAVGSATTVLHGGTTPSYSAVSLTADVSGILPIANGGTGTSTPALIGGTNITITGSWPNQTINATGTGSVTSVAMSVPSFLSISGSPITTSGTLAVTLSGTALPVVNGGTGSTTQNWWGLSGTSTLTGSSSIVGTSTNTIKYSFSGLNITPANGAGLWLQNPDAATVGAQKISPSIVWEGNGWKSNSTASSQAIQLMADLLPIQGTNEPGFNWRLRYSKNGASYSNLLLAGDVQGTQGSTGFEIQANADPNGAVLNLYRNSSSPLANDRLGEIHFFGNNSSATPTQYSAIYSDLKVTTAGAESGSLLMNTTVNGALKFWFTALPNAANDNVQITMGPIYGDAGTNNVMLGNTGSASGSFRYANSTAGQQVMTFTNTSTNAAAYAELDVSNYTATDFTKSLRLISFPTGWSSIGPFQALGGTVEAGSGMSGGLNISSQHSSGKIKFFTAGFNNSNERGRINASGNWITNSTGSDVYRNTNAGSDVNTHFVIDPANSLTSGVAYTFDATNGFGFTQGNGTRRIQFAAIKGTNLTTTAGSEAGGLDFYTQSAGAALSSKISIAPTGNTSIQSLRLQSTSTATAAGTTTLTNASNGIQIFTGSTTQTVVLPVVTTLSNGFMFRVVNLSSGGVTVQTSGSNTVKALAANSYIDLWVLDTTAGTGTASWSWYYNTGLNN